MTLPIQESLEVVRIALRSNGSVVVHAPPGAGKTTGVPPALLDEPWLGGGRIVMLEPRRLAARAAAHRMASLRGEEVGRTVGYRTRLDTRVSAATRIEVVTEGVLTRMLQSDPTLDGYAVVIFDEFHERSLHADTGLALVWHTRRLVRNDLRVVAMSATIDGTAVASLMGGAPIVSAVGRQFDVETRYRPAPAGSRRLGAFDAAFVAGSIVTALTETEGDLLAFLPGAPEIHRTADLLREKRLASNIDVIALHGSLDPADQDRAIQPAAAGRRKIVLSTSIAETSLTIEGVRVVIDSGLSRRSRFSPRTGMSRLETVRTSRASADQRRGRAGRTASGVCYRLWHEDENPSLQQYTAPEILEADLAPLALDLAIAGIANPAELEWLDAPPAAAWSQAGELLQQLQAIDHHGRVTPHGKAMGHFGLHPRLAHMVLRGAAEGHGVLACRIAAILAERDPLRNARNRVGVDLHARLDAMARPREHPDADRGALRRAMEQARKWQARLTTKGDVPDLSALGRVLALAFPERIGLRRPGTTPRYLLRNGGGVSLPEGDSLTRDEFIVVAESDGRVPESRAWLAASMTADDVESDFGEQIIDRQVVEWDEVAGIRAVHERRLGAIVLSRIAIRDPDPALVAAAVASAVRKRGLDVFHWSDNARRLRERLAFLHAQDTTWPDMSEDALMEKLIAGFGEALTRIRSSGQLRALDLSSALIDLLDWNQRRQLDELAPTHFEAPTGSRLPIDYSVATAPTVAIRLQELFGVAKTPTVFGNRVALTLQLLSPAQRPVQVTRDLAGFWKTSYYDVRKDMRARYPKHPWPEDPLNAEPTKRAKRRE